MCYFIKNIAWRTIVALYRSRKISYSLQRAFSTQIILLCTISAECQWNVFQFEPKDQNIISLISYNAKFKNGYTFFGISSDYSDNVISKGYEPFEQDSIWSVAIEFANKTLTKHLYFNLYSENVSSLNVCITLSDSIHYEDKIKFEKDGYQVPFESSFEYQEKVLMSECSKRQNKGCNSSISFCASVEERDKSKPFKLVVGDAKIYETKYFRSPSLGYLFYELTGKNENKLKNYKRNKFGNEYPLLRDADFFLYKDASFNFDFDKQHSDTSSEQETILSLIRFLFTKYPYFKEHHLDRTLILKSVDQVISKSITFENKVELLKKLATSFHDAHFYFKTDNTKSSEVSSPLILKKIKEEVQVVGIRDDRLANSIRLGDKVRSVDGIECSKYIDSLSQFYFGKLSERRELAISHLLEKSVGPYFQTISLSNSNGQTYNVTLSYDKRFPAPAKFKPEHFKYKRLNNGWAYLKINRWDRGDWIKFYNLRDSIELSKGIIFDLRGNPGGYAIDAIQIASCFLKENLVYSVQTYTQKRKTYYGKTIVKPNKYLDLSKTKIIILADNKTACASEAFTLILKEKRNAVLIGSTKTGSSYSTIYSLHLPRNITLVSNVLSKYYFLKERRPIEYTGISPDVLVEIDSYTDLYGYDDKVLMTAEKYIDRSMGTTIINLSKQKK